MEDECEEKADTNKDVMPKHVLTLVVGPPYHRVVPHAPDNGDRAGDEHKLHDGIIHRDNVDEEIQVAGEEHQREQLLRLERDPYRHKNRP